MLKCIMTLRSPDGTYRDVGTNTRTILKAARETTIRRHAREIANGRAFRIEWLTEGEFYKAPWRVTFHQFGVDE